MMNSSMKAKVKRLLLYILVAVFWLFIWDLGSKLFDLKSFLPNVKSTFIALFDLFGKNNLNNTVTSILSSLATIFQGFAIGSFLGIILAIFSILIPTFKTFVYPIMSIAKSTPVTAIILILWLLIGGSNVPTAIALLMVMPIVWQSVISGYDAIDPNLQEVCEIFEFSALKKLKILVIPVILKSLLPALLTASGLAWKAGIAAEIICITKSSIGKEIYNYKSSFNYEMTFAWVIIILIISIIIEKAIGYITKRINQKWHL